jgi:hypothetical protein
MVDKSIHIKIEQYDDLEYKLNIIFDTSKNTG